MTFKGNRGEKRFIVGCGLERGVGGEVELKERGNKLRGRKDAAGSKNPFRLACDFRASDISFGTRGRIGGIGLSRGRSRSRIYYYLWYLFLLLLLFIIITIIFSPKRSHRHKRVTRGMLLSRPQVVAFAGLHVYLRGSDVTAPRGQY